MNLKQISVNSQMKAKSAPTVTFNFLNGRIYFNEATALMLLLKAGDWIAFFQDEDNLHDWYFTKTKIDGSVELKSVNKALTTTSGPIALKLLQSAGIDGTAGFFIAEKKVEGKYWKVLTDRAIRS